MKQTRFIPFEACNLQVRQAEDGQQQSRTVEGRPIVFGVRSVNLTPWSDSREVYEVLEPGCVTNELLQRSDVILNLNHSTLVPDVLGRCRNGKGTLSLTLNSDHIACECDLPHTSNANDTLELMKRGDITGMSFAFEDDWEDTENGVSYERIEERNAQGKEVWLRHVKRITGLYDVAIVTHPAYEQTSVGTREQCDRINAAIEAQLKREQGADPAATVPAGSASGEETPEQRAAREQAEREQAERDANGGETNAEKAAREQREAEAREAEEQEQRERELLLMRRRARMARLTDEIFNQIEY